jgi:predicted metal-dependent TIM-barrel fold hydrolase
MEILPRFALKEGVVAIGEIGYDEQTAARGPVLPRCSSSSPRSSACR